MLRFPFPKGLKRTWALPTDAHTMLTTIIKRYTINMLVSQMAAVLLSLGDVLLGMEGDNLIGNQLLIIQNSSRALLLYGQRKVRMMFKWQGHNILMSYHVFLTAWEFCLINNRTRILALQLLTQFSLVHGTPVLWATATAFPGINFKIEKVHRSLIYVRDPAPLYIHRAIL